ncbi:S1C family serine protease [Bradyrhizobium sp. HKCCYLS3013]|uniref:S1C family serine protease n=1 Tax=Bradyrhizobium sp. HKCCYLS3013 TaxID=3420735 RepID=UPI003EB7E80F
MDFSLKSFSKHCRLAIATPAFVALQFLQQPAARADSGEYARVGGWSIRYDETEEINACYARIAFADSTTLLVTLAVSDKESAWSLAFANPKWDGALGKRNKIHLFITTTSEWEGNFEVSERVIMVKQLSEEFVQSVADARSISIKNESKQSIAIVSMQDSANAINAIRRCVHDHPRKSAPTSGWSLGYDQQAGICIAKATFTDGTAVGLGFVQAAREDERGFGLLVINPKWRDLTANKTQIRLQLVTTREFDATFDVSDGVLSVGPLKDEFMASVITAGFLGIRTDAGQSLALLNMQDAISIVRSIKQCVEDHRSRAKPSEVSVITGTGFFVARGVIVTANHVVSGCTSPIKVRYADRAEYAATVYGQDDANDLALLRTDMGNAAVASFSLQARLGDRVAAFGFPLAGLLPSVGNFTTGDVTALTGLGNDTRFLQTSAPVQSGNSGGPLLDMSGRVVGIVDSKLNALAMMKAGRDIPELINFAIVSQIVVNFLSRRGVSPEISAATKSAQELSSADVAEIGQKISVQVFCLGRTDISGSEK